MLTYSRTQAIIAGASGIAEWYGIATCAAETLFLKELFERMGFIIEFVLLTDSSAAKGIGQRQGAGQLRTLECKTLWVQKAVEDKKIILAKCPGKENLADLGTKAYDRAALELLTGLNLKTIHELKGLGQEVDMKDHRKMKKNTQEDSQADEKETVSYTHLRAHET